MDAPTTCDRRSNRSAMATAISGPAKPPVKLIAAKENAPLMPRPRVTRIDGSQLTSTKIETRWHTLNTAQRMNRAR